MAAYCVQGRPTSSRRAPHGRLFECLTCASCEAAPRNDTRTTPFSAFRCAEGHTGVLCAECQAAWYWKRKACLPCDADFTSSGTFAALAVLAAVLVLLRTDGLAALACGEAWEPPPEHMLLDRCDMDVLPAEQFSLEDFSARYSLRRPVLLRNSSVNAEARAFLADADENARGLAVPARRLGFVETDRSQTYRKVKSAAEEAEERAARLMTTGNRQSVAAARRRRKERA